MLLSIRAITRGKVLMNFLLHCRAPFWGSQSATEQKLLGRPHAVRFALYASLIWFPCMAAGDTISRRVPQFLDVTRLGMNLAGRLQQFNPAAIARVLDNADFLDAGLAHGATSDRLNENRKRTQDVTGKLDSYSQAESIATNKQADDKQP